MLKKKKKRLYNGNFHIAWFIFKKVVLVTYSLLSTLISTEFFDSLSSNCKIEASSKKFVKTLITRPGKKMTEKFYANFFFAKFKGTNCNSELVARLTSIAIKQNYAPKGTYYVRCCIKITQSEFRNNT